MQNFYKEIHKKEVDSQVFLEMFTCVLSHDFTDTLVLRYNMHNFPKRMPYATQCWQMLDEVDQFIPHNSFLLTTVFLP